MKCILTIGYVSVLLPNTTGIESIIKHLSKGIEVSSYLYMGKVEIKHPAQIIVELVPEGTRFIDKNHDETSIDEHVPSSQKRINARLLNGQPALRLPSA